MNELSLTINTESNHPSEQWLKNTLLRVIKAELEELWKTHKDIGLTFNYEIISQDTRFTDRTTYIKEKQALGS